MDSPPDVPPIDQSGLPFVIDVAGCFPPARLRVHHDPTPRPTTPELDRLISEEWDQRLDLARRHDRMLFNGDLFRYVHHAVIGESADPVFELTVGPTCYRDFVGTNLFNNHRLAEFGWERFANPIGTTATLITRDGRICYGRRSTKVAYHAEHVHTFGGGLEAGDRAADGTIDPFGSLRRELAEELGLAAADLTDLRCMGLIRDREIHQPELLFEAEVRHTVAELEESWAAAPSRNEHDGLVSLPNEPEAIIPFIHACDKIAPVAIGALFLHGRRRWGDHWFQASAKIL